MNRSGHRFVNFDIGFCEADTLSCLRTSKSKANQIFLGSEHFHTCCVFKIVGTLKLFYLSMLHRLCRKRLSKKIKILTLARAACCNGFVVIEHFMAASDSSITLQNETLYLKISNPNVLRNTNDFIWTLAHRLYMSRGVQSVKRISDISWTILSSFELLWRGQWI